MSRLWFHWQNLNDNGRELLYGRAWLYFGRERAAHPAQKCVQVSWRIGPWHWLSLKFDRGGEDDYAFAIGLGFVDLYVILSGFRAYDTLPRDWPRSTGIGLYGDNLVVEWDCDDSSWSSATGPAHGRSRSWCLLDVLLGRARYDSREEEPVFAVVAMPEAEYHATVTMHDDTWKRPRWPWPKRVRRATVDVPFGGVPIPGKGENAWDCGEDAVHGQTAPAATPEEAVEKLRAYALGRRAKYGGRNWTPECVRG